MLQEIQSRSALLLGQASMQKLSTCRVILFGVGGVGSWAAEALVRTGLKHITIVDSDEVAPSNINRQLMANVSTIGKSKVDALKEHLLLVNPEAEVTTINGIYSAQTAEQFQLETYDYVVDCIDSLEHKVALILHATSLPCEFYASMGAALKLDPTKVSVAEFWKVKGCPLAAALRRRIKKGGRMPRKKFKCVYSEELLQNATDVDLFLGGTWDDKKAQINGSLMHITALFGMTLAGLILQSIYNKTEK
jgi:tRNA A37 threonylcarbamoyladenosine dehydratase